MLINIYKYKIDIIYFNDPRYLISKLHSDTNYKYKNCNYITIMRKTFMLESKSIDQDQDCVSFNIIQKNYFICKCFIVVFEN